VVTATYFATFTRWAKVVTRHPLVLLASMLIAAGAGIVTMMGPLHDQEGSLPGAGSTYPAPTQRGAEPAASGNFAVIAGTCLDGHAAPVACDVTHRYEVFGSLQSARNCNRQAMVKYLGGSSSIDVLVAAVGPSTLHLGDTDMCAVDLGQPVQTSFQDILKTRRGDGLRRCWDSGTEAEVPCSSPHTAEVISSPDVPAQLTCPQLAERYLEVPLDVVRFDVRTAVVRGDPDECRIVALGDNVLTASLRNLRSGTIPLTAAR
jgi:hypothetical protein